MINCQWLIVNFGKRQQYLHFVQWKSLHLNRDHHFVNRKYQYASTTIYIVALKIEQMFDYKENPHDQLIIHH